MATVLCLLLFCLGAVHPGSMSSSKIRVDGEVVEQVLRVQALSLIEVLPIDTNEDLFLDEAEFEAGRDSIREYLMGCYDIQVNGDDQPIPRKITELSLQDEGPRGLPSACWVQARFMGMHSEAIANLRIEERLFESSEPSHIEIVTVSWKGQVATKVIFSPEQSSQSFEPSGEARKSGLRQFFELGVRHILTGYDHLLFLLALFVAVRGVRSLAWMVTAFTVAHSVTLAAAALDWISLPPRFVELAIALSIVYVAVENLLGWTRRNLWAEALGFGLLHGLGFAGFLGDALADEDAILVPLLGFNLGVEVGQFVAVLPCAILCVLLLKKRSQGASADEVPLLVPDKLGRFLSLLIAAAGSYWFLERAGFLPF